MVLQASRAECGVACLAMVLGHHRHPASVSDLRAACPVGRDGVSAGAIVRAARRLQMAATGHPADPAVLDRMALPAIAHWQGNHFVVVERVSSRRVLVVDPQLGRRRLSRGDFDAGVGRVVLQLRPGADLERREGRAVPFWRRYLRSLLTVPGARPLLAQVVLVTVLTQLLVVSMPLATKVVVDESGRLAGSSLLSLMGAGIVVAAVAQLIIGLLRSALLIRLQGLLDAHALTGFTAHLLGLPIRYFEHRGAGDIVTRFGAIALLRELVTSQTLAAMLDAVLVCTYLVVLLVIDVPIGLVCLAFVGAVVLLLWLSTSRVRERMALDLSGQSHAQSYLVEMVDGITTLKASAAEGRALNRINVLLAQWLSAALRRSLASAVIDSVTAAVRFLAPLLVLWLCVQEVLAGELSSGTMLAVTWLAAAIVAPLSTVAVNGQRLQLAGEQLHRLGDVLDTQREPALPDPVAPEVASGPIVLEHMQFRYDPYSLPVLDDVNLTIRAGERIAVVGSTGSGKSTLALLLLGLYTPTDGRITIAGRAISELDPQAVRRRFGVVLQEQHLFSGTIRENITLHEPGITDDAVVRATRLACLHDEIVAMPQGYATYLTSRGRGLSGGQRQRLALARALVREPQVLLLDEATSHLDAETERRVHSNLANLTCSRIVIAHRLSTIRDADRIVVLHRGRLVESGTHDELLTRRGRYADLVGSQLDNAGSSAPSPHASPESQGHRRP